ncbi:MAG TPA: molybdate ABC transporter substrate-binding protein [Rhizobacter sp.]
MAPVRLVSILLAACCSFGAHGAELTVSAAASLTHVFHELGPVFEAAHPGHKLRFNHAASGALLQQIANGAPVDVLATADPETMDLAQARGLVQAAQRRNFASNTLVLVVPVAGRHSPKTLADLAQPAYQRIAIGLPASVPVGRYTRSVLEAAGQWSAIEPKTVGAHNARQALDYVARAEVDAGFVFATDAALARGKVRVAFTVPTTTPILYPAAPVSASPNAALAQRFVEFLVSPAAQAVLARHGFGQP